MFVNMRRKATAWVVRLLARWGVISHPYGENYAKRTIGPLGGCRDPDEPDHDRLSSRTSMSDGGSRTDDSADS